jgi:hypothetical protein
MASRNEEAMTALAEQIFIQVGRKRYQVETLKHASEMYCAARDALGEGASRFPQGKIVTADGRFVARISFNGRVWSSEDYVVGETPIYDNRS